MIYTIQNQALQVQVNDLGAELWSVLDLATQTEHLWQGIPSIWPLRSPTIFPYCGRIKDFQFHDDDGTIYQGINHGFSRTSVHRLVSQTRQSLTLQLASSKDTLKKYPFSFILETTYRLESRQLHWEYRLENTGNHPMPFNLGCHPGYMCPFSAEYPIDDYALRFEQSESPIQLITDSEGQLRTGEQRVWMDDVSTIPLNDHFFPKNFCLTNLRSRYVDILERPTGRYVRVYFKPYHNLVLWSKPERVHFVCIESWTGLADDVNSNYRLQDKRDIQILAPGETFSIDMVTEIGRDG